MHFVYILHSASADRYYVGESYEPEQRLVWHNTHQFKKAYTKIANDWVLIFILSVANRSEAQTIERYIKSMKSSAFLKKLVNDISFYDNFKSIVKEKFNITVLN